MYDIFLIKIWNKIIYFNIHIKYPKCNSKIDMKFTNLASLNVLCICISMYRNGQLHKNALNLRTHDITVYVVCMYTWTCMYVLLFAYIFHCELCSTGNTMCKRKTSNWRKNWSPMSLTVKLLNFSLSNYLIFGFILSF